MRRYIVLHKTKLALFMLTTTMVAGLTAYFPFAVRDLVDIGLARNLGSLIGKIIFTALIIVTTLLFEYFSKLTHARLTTQWIEDLRNDLMSKLIKRSHRSYLASNSAEYISVLTNDVDMIRTEYFNTVTAFIQTIGQGLFCSYAIFTLSPAIALTVLLFGALPLCVPRLTGHTLSLRKKRQSDSLALLTSRMKDIFSGFEVIRSFGVRRHFENEFRRINRQTESRRYEYSAYRSAVDVVSGSCNYAITYATLGLGAYLLAKGRLTAGEFVAAVNLMEVVSMPIRDVVYELLNIRSVRPVAEKLVEILDEEPTEEYGTGKCEFRDRICFRDVCFSYPNGFAAVSHIDLVMEKGKKYAVVGPSGSGKTTLLRLLLGYYDDYSGFISMDDADYRSLRSDSIGGIVAAIHQDVFMFDSTIRDNICLFAQYDQSAVDSAVNLSGLKPIVDNAVGGLDSSVGENGNKLSGGEKQRVAIARALIRKYPVLVADEATASLDKDTSLAIENSILELKGITFVSITHRLDEEMLSRYDEIIVMREGEIVERGSLVDLISAGQYFCSLLCERECGVRRDQ